jgi:hypothetical protein
MNRSSTALALMLALAGAACTGNLESKDAPGASGDPSQSGAPSDEPLAQSCNETSRLPRALRGLNTEQYQNTIAAVLPGAELKDVFSVSDRSAPFSTHASIRRFDFNGVRYVIQNAEAAAATLKQNLSPRFACLAGTIDTACMRQVTGELGRELYNEPLQAAQLDKLMALFEQHKASDAEAAAELVVSALLSSPRFLFRKELGRTGSDAESFELSSHEVASAIAYTLTNAPPDAELRALADADALRDPARVRSEIERVLAKPEGVRGLQSFFGELLRARNFVLTEKSAEHFPTLDDATRQALLADFDDTVALTLRSATPTLRELLTGRGMVVRPDSNALLGWSFSGLSDAGTPVTSNEPGRMGLLTHPVVMATHAHQVETNPVARGHLVSEKILCVTVPPPPQAVMFPQRIDDGVPRTLRQTLEAQHSIDSCAGCHALMDPLGYPFEVFDGIGKLRSTDAGLPIDSSGNIPNTGEIDGPVQNVEELLTRVAGSRTAEACFTENTVKYVAGIDKGAPSDCMRDTLAPVFTEKQGNVRELVISLLSSSMFLRRGETP